MEENKKETAVSNFGFYFLMGIIGISILYIVGYLIYTAIFG
ncbi:MAG: hypothetical protein FD122_222 [Stygiobacter sp.]|nr:MAG: hypothetical protein FD122_222 [Stygiobacter sp.]KAF0214544.1 MAG: hypothetical protein FD178_2335 [Ignavibacteria bacterium]